MTIEAGAVNEVSWATTGTPEDMLTSWVSNATVGALGSGESPGRLIEMKVAITAEKRPVFNALV